MSQNATRNAKGNPSKYASNTKQTQNTEDTSSTTKNSPKDGSRIAEALKPTPEQIRLATILAVKNDNSENNVKVKQIIEVCPDVNEDEALMVLHENDYDVNRVIEYLMEGGGVSLDWKTAGTKPSKPKPSPNQTLDEEQAEAPRAPAFKDERRNRDKRAKPTDRKPRPSNVDLTENGANLEERVGFLDLKDADENASRPQIRRGGGRGGFGGRGRGALGRGAPRGRVVRNERREPRRAQNEFINSSLKNTVDDLEDNNDKVLPQSDQGESNLREIGTWSNEQAGKGRRFNQRFNGQSHVQAEEYENDEEWQGDLSKTQIFTASTQKKEFAEAVQQNDFPIGHFNAEEASQNIKKAVGIGSQVSPAGPVAQTPEQNEAKSKQNPKVPPSAKPLPPPTTKIPKSAVIMPDGSTSNSINFNLDLQFGVDLDDQLVSKTKNVSSQPVQQPSAKSLNCSKPVETASKMQKPQAQAQPATKPQPFVGNAQVQQQSQTIAAQPQRQQFQNKETAAHLLNISPSNKLSNSNTQQQPQQVLNQLQQIQTSHQSTASVVNPNKVTPNSNPNPPTTPGGTVPPPPGVGLLNPNNLVNPNNPYLIGLPFNQNFPYFDQSQIDANLVQMYNHLANIPPPGVGAPSGQSGSQYPISDSKFPRNEVGNSNAPLNAPNPGNVSGQLNQPQQQQPPINLIPYLNNYPFFFPNNPYPNMFMQIPNGGQTTPGTTNQPPPPPFVNKPPYTHNFPNNQEDYANYPAQANSQMKSSSSNLSNVNDMTNPSYSKTDKPQSGYHAPTPPNNFSNQLLNQQNQQGQHLGNGQSGPQPMAYIASMMGSHSGNMVHPGIQDNLNRSSGPNNLKQKYNWNQ